MSAFTFKAPFGAASTAAAIPSTGFSFGTSSTTPGFGAGAATTTSASSLGAFGFGSSTSTATPAFGAASVSGFGFGATPSTALSFGTSTTSVPSTGFGVFGATSSAAPAFGTATTCTGATSSFTGFGLSANPFGTMTSTTSTLGLKAPMSTAFGLGAAGGLANTAGPTQPGGSTSASLIANMCTAVSAPLLFGDERDAVIAKWNQVQAFWGTGRGYYNSQGHFVNFTPDNPYSFFKAVGYNVMPTARNEDGHVALTIDRKMSEVCDKQQVIVDTLQRIIVNNQPNVLVCVEGIRPLLDDKTEVTIYVQQRANTGVVSRVSASDLYSHIGSVQVKQSLTSQLAVSAAVPKCGMLPEQLKVYLDNPPAGIDTRIWDQAKLDNPDPSRLIPVPIVGFSELHQRLKHQEQQSNLHQQRLEMIAGDIATLQRNQADIVAKTEQYKRNQLALGHRILKVLVVQELCRKHGYAIQVDDEHLRSRLEAIHAELSAPMQFKGRLNELMSQIRMHSQFGVTSASDTACQMDKSVQQEIQQHLKHQQDGLAHLINIIKDDLQHVDIIEQSLSETGPADRTHR